MQDAQPGVKFALAGTPDRKLSIWLFRKVTNSRQIQEKIMSGSMEPELAFINAALVPDLLVLRAAAQKALAAQIHGTLRTRSLHAEVVYNLAGSKHVGESLKRFGVSNGCEDILVASLNPGCTEAAMVQRVVDGELTDISTLHSLADTATLKKIYKIVPAELDVGSLTDAICCRIAASHC